MASLGTRTSVLSVLSVRAWSDHADAVLHCGAVVHPRATLLRFKSALRVCGTRLPNCRAVQCSQAALSVPMTSFIDRSGGLQAAQRENDDERVR